MANTLAANNARPIHAALRLGERRSRSAEPLLIRNVPVEPDGRARFDANYWVIERGRGLGSGALEIRSTIKSRKARILSGTYLRLT